MSVNRAAGNERTVTVPGGGTVGMTSADVTVVAAAGDDDEDDSV